MTGVLSFFNRSECCSLPWWSIHSYLERSNLSLWYFKLLSSRKDCALMSWADLGPHSWLCGGQCRDPASASRFGFVCFSFCCFIEPLRAVRSSFPAAAAARRTAVKLTLCPERGGKWAAVGRSWLKRPKSVCSPTGPSLCEYFVHFHSLAILYQCYSLHI